MEGFLIFLAMFIGIPVILYVSTKNNFGSGKYNKKTKDKK